MSDPTTRLWALAARQYAALSRRQALSGGLTRGQVDGYVSHGRLWVIHRGVYGVAGSPRTFEQGLMAACLASGGLASHRSAAALWRLRGFEPGPVEITVPTRRRAELHGVIAHTTDRLDSVDAAERVGIPVTTPARTLLDLGAVAEAGDVACAVEDALLRRLVSVPTLVRTLQRLGSPGRNGSGVLRQLIEERGWATPPTESPLEDLLLQLLRAAGLPEPVRQHRLALPNGRSVRLDFAYPPNRVALEANSVAWHSGLADVQRNAAKANALVALGWRLLQFTFDDMRRRPTYVTGTVGRELALPFPAFPPSPAS